MCFKNHKKSKTFDNNSTEEMANIFNILGDFTRCKIVTILCQNKMKCSEIAKELNMSNSAISHSIKSLKQCKIIQGERNGKEIFYSITDKHLIKIIESTKEYIEK